MNNSARTEKAEKKSITFISRAAPYGQDKANLCLDMALASAVFEQNINYVFMEDGVYQLLKGQDATAIQSKTLGNSLETLELYGIENIHVDKSSLEERGFSEIDILSGTSIISREAISTLIQQSDSVFNL